MIVSCENRIAKARIACAALLLCLIRAVSSANDVPLPTATAWPEADALFRNDPQWVGADDAYSVDLGHGRILWLFADTLIDPSGKHSRQGSQFIHNSVAIQNGSDPSAASVRFCWHTANAKPASFFPETKSILLQGKDAWYWPGGGTFADGRLLIFLMRVHAAGEGAFGFKVSGSVAVLIDNPDADPAEWHTQTFAIPSNRLGVVIGSGSAFEQSGYLYAFGSVEPGRHDIYANRWAAPLAAQGRFDDPEWWLGTSGGWVPQSRLVSPARGVFGNGQTEFTVHFSTKFACYLEFQTLGFGAADIAMRTAPQFTGPWTTLRAVYAPPEKNRPRVFVYAGKAHPELTGADLVLTYASNSSELGDVIRDQSLYYPRFVRLNFR